MHKVVPHLCGQSIHEYIPTTPANNFYSIIQDDSQLKHHTAPKFFCFERQVRMIGWIISRSTGGSSHITCTSRYRDHIQIACASYGGSKHMVYLAKSKKGWNESVNAIAH
jgi:hypothetical protein